MGIRWQSSLFLEGLTGDSPASASKLTCSAPLWTPVYIWEARCSLRCMRHLLLLTVHSCQVQDCVMFSSTTALPHSLQSEQLGNNNQPHAVFACLFTV